MKNVSLLFFACLVTMLVSAQGSLDFSLKTTPPVTAPPPGGLAPAAPAPGAAVPVDTDIDFTHLKRIGLIGIGNLNTETFNEVNASGKFSGFIRPVRHQNDFLTVNFAFNVNASNTDSLLTLSFLFPDVGRNSFYVNTDYSFAIDRNENEAHLLTPFLEFYTKSIKATRDEQERSFSTLNYTAGGRYQYYFREGEDEFSLTASVYGSLINVPNEDVKDYRYLFTGDENSSLNSLTRAVGAKFTFQVNRFQVFADLKHVLGNEQDVPIRELRGFNSNVGVLFNATIFQK